MAGSIAPVAICPSRPAAYARGAVSGSRIAALHGVPSTGARAGDAFGMTDGCHLVTGALRKPKRDLEAA